MQKTPLASRKHVSIFGKVNAGKSSLFNAILGQEAAIVSEYAGTTTDPVIKAMELIPFGPIALVDTAGLDDKGEIGEQRIKKTNLMLKRTDLAIYAIDIQATDYKEVRDAALLFREKNIPYLLVFTKCDLVSGDIKANYQEKYKEALFIDHYDKESLTKMKKKICEKLETFEMEDERMIGNLLETNSLVIMVVPIDSAAPKGRLILPQVQFIRECLDHGIQCLVTRESELSQVLDRVKKVDLVVTDSQIFPIVSKIVPVEIPLTSFSMLLAKQKGDISLLIEGVKKVDHLEENAKILMAEACTHNDTHEDIGRVKIPALMKKHTGRELQFDFYVGYDFPENLEEYAMVIHCGACMLSKRAIQNRLKVCQDKKIPVTNYGVLLAYLNGILPRCSEIFDRN